MIGIIVGDIAGSQFEHHNRKSKDFDMFRRRCRVTDDSVMSLAVAKSILDCVGDYEDLSQYTIENMQRLGKRYPHAGYGHRFKSWIFEDDPQPYNSWGNGSAMRVGPCGFAARSIEEAKKLSEEVTKVTHDHPEGLKGAEAIAVAVYLANTGSTKEEIRQHILENYYDIDFTLDEIRPTYQFDVSCQGSVPQALEAFFEAEDFEDTIRNAISIGGDSDTIAAMAGAVAEAYYGVPDDLVKSALQYMDEYQLEILINFEERYPGK